MDKEKLGQEPAFPTEPIDVVVGQHSYNYQDENGNSRIGYQNEFGKQTQQGMSKRFYAACAAMTGILSNENVLNGKTSNGPSEFVRLAYKCADEILKQENK